MMRSIKRAAVSILILFLSVSASATAPRGVADLDFFIHVDIAQDQIKAIATMRSRTQLSRMTTRAEHVDIGDGNRSGAGTT